MSAIVVASLVDKGFLQYDAKVADYWPEFGTNGKENLKLEDILRHEGGLTTFKHSFQWNEFSREHIKKNVIGSIIEQCKSEYPRNHSNPNGTVSKRSYHAQTRGFILNEIVRRVDPNGRTIGEICREELEIEDICCGIDDDQFDRLTKLEANTMGWVATQSVLPYFLGSKVHISILDLYRLSKHMQGSREKLGPQKPSIANVQKDPSMAHTVYEQKEIRRGEIPSANFQGNARGLAKLASVMANKGQSIEGENRILTERTWDVMHEEGKWAQDALLGKIVFIKNKTSL